MTETTARLYPGQAVPRPPVIHPRFGLLVSLRNSPVGRCPPASWQSGRRSRARCGVGYVWSGLGQALEDAGAALDHARSSETRFYGPNGWKRGRGRSRCRPAHAAVGLPVRTRLRVGSPGASRKAERRLSSKSIPQPSPFGCVPGPVGLPSRSCQLGEVAERPVRLVPGYPGTAIAPFPCPHPCPRPRPCPRPCPCPHRGCESCSPSCRCGSSAAPGSSPSDQLSASCWCPDWS